jgi:hypothetical protein
MLNSSGVQVTGTTYQGTWITNKSTTSLEAVCPLSLDTTISYTSARVTGVNMTSCYMGVEDSVNHYTFFPGTSYSCGTGMTCYQWTSLPSPRYTAEVNCYLRAGAMTAGAARLQRITLVRN